MREDVLSKLLEVEKEARRIIADADADADSILEEARSEAARIVAEARREGREQADALVAEHQQELARRKQERLERERAQLPNVEELPPQALQDAVEVIIQAVAKGNEPPEQNAPQ
jgi:vacuolar-type H+-ATPase subunit H